MVSKKEKDSFPLYYVEWWDHCSHTTSNWRDLEDTTRLEPILIKSAGWVVKETKKYMLMVSTIAAPIDGVTQTMCNDILILKGNIKFRKKFS